MNFKFTYSEIEELGGNLPMKKRKSRFTFDEVHLLLSEVKRNRHILVSKYLHSVCTVCTNYMDLIIYEVYAWYYVRPLVMISMKHSK